ncbi:SIS domain-containing protein [Streptomyces sp. NPDC050738]|uniref:SIS domain-containing protein n=1 Tax=Streptomyces sp. NPDC050738 TaxID=3154744 RepID=UPI00341C3480
MLDETLLDTPDALARADRHGLLRGAAEAGARVRTAARHAVEAGIAELKPEGRPRALLLAGPGTAATGVADLLAALAGTTAPVTRLAPTGVAPAAGALRWALPGWAGPVDLLLITTTDGTEPGLALLAEQAYRRGCTVVAVAPRSSPLTEAVEVAHGLYVPLATAPRTGDQHPDEAQESAASPGAFWSLLTPLLILLDRLGILTAPTETISGMADRLDRTAERCGPAITTYSNPAKTLASELAESLPLIWSEGTATAAAGRRFAAVLGELAGHPALTAELPEAIAAHSTLLGASGGGQGAPDVADSADDFFRDRADDAQTLRPRAILLRDRPAGGLTAAPAARDLALAHNAPLSELEPEEGTDLEALAALIATTDFAAVYLALATA